MFENMPVAAAVTLLSKLQNDVQMPQTQTSASMQQLLAQMSPVTDASQTPQQSLAELQSLSSLNTANLAQQAQTLSQQIMQAPQMETQARRMVDLILGKRATDAITILKFAPQSAALPVRKTLESAIANARVKADKAGEPFRENDLFIRRPMWTKA